MIILTIYFKMALYQQLQNPRESQAHQQPSLTIFIPTSQHNNIWKIRHNYYRCSRSLWHFLHITRKNLKHRNVHQDIHIFFKQKH